MALVVVLEIVVMIGTVVVTVPGGRGVLDRHGFCVSESAVVITSRSVARSGAETSAPGEFVTRASRFRRAAVTITAHLCMSGRQSYGFNSDGRAGKVRIV